MLKKLPGVLVLITAAVTAATASAQTIAEWDFGKEVLRLQGEEGYICEYDAFADRVVTGGTWDGGALLKVTDEFDALPEEDEDKKLSYSYAFDIADGGIYKVLIQATLLDNDYYSKWELELDGVPVSVSKTQNRKVDITAAQYFQAALDKGRHVLTFKVPKAAKGGEGNGRFYFYLDYIDFHYCYDFQHNFSEMVVRDPSASASAYPAEYEFVSLRGNKTQDCCAEFIFDAPSDGFYLLDFDAQAENHGSISSFEAFINDARVYTKDDLARLAYANAKTTSNAGDRQYLRKYQFAVRLRAGKNTLKLVSLNDGKANQWLLLDTIQISMMEQADRERLRIEGENFTVAGDLFSQLTHGSTKLIGYSEFSNGIALQSYGSRADGSTDEIAVKYNVAADETGKYGMGFLAGLLYSAQTTSGGDFDVSINGVRYAVGGNVTRTANYIPASASKAAADMYIYGYNNPVYLNAGDNEVIVHIKPRPSDGQFIFSLDYIDFTLKEAGAKPVAALAVSNVIYNGIDTLPSVGQNTVEFEVGNQSPYDSGKINIITAVYTSGNILKDAYLQTSQLNKGAVEFLTVNNLNYSAGDRIKIFLWNAADQSPASETVYTCMQE